MARKYHVNIASVAERDIEDIRRWIATSHPLTADRFIEELYEHTSTLERFPKRCPLILENKVPGRPYRHLIHKKYRIIFRIEKNTVYVVRVLHGSKSLRRL